MDPAVSIALGLPPFIPGPPLPVWAAAVVTVGFGLFLWRVTR